VNVKLKVWLFFKDGYHFCEGEDLGAEAAVTLAKRVTLRCADRPDQTGDDELANSCHGIS
jgi:hypothetical protein